MASFVAPPNAAAPPNVLGISKETPIDIMANNIFEYWKIYKLPSLLFIINVQKIMKPILMTAGSKLRTPLEILPSETYKDFLSYFSKNYKNYPDKFIKELFIGTFEENNISGVIRIVANQHDYDLVDKATKEVVYVDSELLETLRKLDKIEPVILGDGIRVRGTHAKNAVISNTIINQLNNKRLNPVVPVNNHKRKRTNTNNTNNTNKTKWAARAGTRKRHRKSKATRRKKH